MALEIAQVLSRLTVSLGLILSDSYVEATAILLYIYFLHQKMFYSIGSDSISLECFQF